MYNLIELPATLKMRNAALFIVALPAGGLELI